MQNDLNTPANLNFKRFEIKYYLNDFQAECLLTQLQNLMEFDKHSAGGNSYRVRSLYFDSFDDECLYQKQSGFLNRQKIRLRTYGVDNNSVFKFEIKRKNNQIIKKDSAIIGLDLAKQANQGSFDELRTLNNPLLDEIYATFSARFYKPKVVVEYDRIALMLPYSNIRITFDQNLRSNLSDTNLMNVNGARMPVIQEEKQILEVKYDGFFPPHIKNILSSYAAEKAAISKYTLARRFNKLEKWEDN